MNKNKYYRVFEMTDKSGKTVYKVFSSQSKLDVLFGFWTEYEKDNETLNEAIQQVKNLDSWSIKLKKLVYKFKAD